MMYFLNILSGALIGVGLFLISCDIFRVPAYKTSRTLIGIEKQYNTKESKINTSLEEIAVWISKRLILRDHKKAKLQANLYTARMSITPEMYVATCIVKATVVAVLAFLLMPMFLPGGIVLLVGSVVYYIALYQELEQKVKAHREAIEFELGQFIFTIERVLMNNRNVVQMLENYRDIAGPAMKQELEITLADMLSSNYEQAISRLEIRVGSIMMSDVCRGLISVIRGDDTAAYWVNLQTKFAEHQRGILKRKADKIPARVNRLSMALLFCFMALWLGVLIIQMAESFIEMFSAI